MAVKKHLYYSKVILLNCIIYYRKMILTWNSLVAWTRVWPGRYLKQSTISRVLLVGQPIRAPNFLAFSKEFSVCVQQSSAVPLIDMPPVY